LTQLTIEELSATSEVGPMLEEVFKLSES
jgi:hypothetical protein